MDELSLASAVIETAGRHAEGRRVSAVHLRIGRLRQVVPAALRLAFGAAARGTPCVGARLTLDEVPMRLRCDACGHGWEPRVLRFRCPACEAATVAAVTGEEFEVDWIGVAQVDEPATA